VSAEIVYIAQSRDVNNKCLGAIQGWWLWPSPGGPPGQRGSWLGADARARAHARTLALPPALSRKW